MPHNSPSKMYIKIEHQFTSGFPDKNFANTVTCTLWPSELNLSNTAYKVTEKTTVLSKDHWKIKMFYVTTANT